MKKTRVQLNCEICGAEFMRKKSHASRSKNYCSVQCSNIGKSKIAYQKMCDLVGRDFKEWLVVQYIDNLKGAREISREVYGSEKSASSILKWMNRLGIEKRNRSDSVRTQWINNDERRVAQAEFIKRKITPKIRAKINKVMQTEEYKEKQRISKIGENNGMYGVYGKNHPKWNPERTHEQRVKERKTGKDKAWRLAVFERDKFTCQFCGDARGGNLVAHHVNSYSKHKELRHDPSNGITLCEDCHKDYHSAYGWKNATAEKFKLFMQKTMIA